MPQLSQKHNRQKRNHLKIKYNTRKVGKKGQK